MPKVKLVEKKIWDVEGFDIQFRRDGKDVRGDKGHIPQYQYERAAKNDMTVAEWREGRFTPSYLSNRVRATFRAVADAKNVL